MKQKFFECLCEWPTRLYPTELMISEVWEAWYAKPPKFPEGPQGPAVYLTWGDPGVTGAGVHGKVLGIEKDSPGW